MPVFTKFKLLALMLLLASDSVLARDPGVFIKNLSVYRQQHKYLLDADVKFQFSPAVEEALRNGVSLVWAVRVKVWKKRRFLWDDPQVIFTDYYRIRYYALLDMFQIWDEQRQTLKRFTSLRSALIGLGRLRNIRLINEAEIQDAQHYDVGLQIVLEKEQLPLPLRTVAHVSHDWALSSEWQRRSLNP